MNLPLAVRMGEKGAGVWSLELVESPHMRDHRNLRAFELADQLAMAIYQATSDFPQREQFGLTIQMQRAAVSVASNIVEGCARRTETELVRFLDMAYGSARELEYQLSLATRLGYLSPESAPVIGNQCEETCKVLAGLIRSFRRNDNPSA